MKIKTKQVLKFVLLPGILPRLRDLFGAGAGFIPFFLAQIYYIARLLPANHPYLNSSHMGDFGVHHVIAEARRNLKFRKENADQIVLFSVTILGLFLFGAQFVMLITALFMQVAHAAPLLSYMNYFDTPVPMNDIAFVMLDRVFGVPGLFVNSAGMGSCVAMGVPCFADLHPYSVADARIPWPIHLALHKMLMLYSIALLVVALMIFLYFVVAVVVETAQSGTPFGKRFNHAWAPLRMVLALGLLIPVANGLNAAQYITLYAAKWGSGFATNGWNLFTGEALNGGGSLTLLGSSSDLVAKPQPPALTNLLEFNTVLQTCWASYSKRDIEIQGYFVKDSRNAVPYQMLTTATSYDDAMAFYGKGDILIRFGVQDDTAYSGEMGSVKQLCGEIVMQTNVTDKTKDPGAYYAQEKYFELVRDLWMGSTSGTGGGAIDMENWGQDIVAHLYDKASYKMPDSSDIERVKEEFRQITSDIVDQAVMIQSTGSDWYYMNTLGWGGAGIWYNKIAESNGNMTTAIQHLPVVRTYPDLMEYVKKERLKEDTSVNPRETYTDTASGGKKIEYKQPEDEPTAKSMNTAFTMWDDGYEPPTGNIFVDAIKALFGLEGLFNMRENANIHPLAQLSAVGKSLVESSIRNLGFSMLSGVGGGMAAIVGAHGLGDNINAASGFFFGIAMMALSIGFMLFYLLPLMPFLYFFFAVGNWVKGLFEAMVGVPLWALAHLRIDGNGLPGDVAMGGYFLILEIFLRPILIIFGMLGGILIFSAQVRVLNDIFDLVTDNLSGFDTAAAEIAADGSIEEVMGNLRDYVDQFFFTVIYAVLVFMMAQASFKMVDMVPNHILNWLGSQVQSFGDESGDIAQNLMQQTSVGTQQIMGQLGGLRQGAMSAAKEGGAFLTGKE